MILSVSRKTDIPAFYSQWFFNRIKEGFCYTQNPMNTKQISKVLINPDLIDGIVFWTKNPKPMITRLNEIKQFSFYFQYTINSYGADIEAHLPRKKELVETFKVLSNETKPDCMVWRYDPILLNAEYTIDYHIKHFETLAKNLSGYSHRVVISYIDFYDKISSNWARLGIQKITKKEKEILADNLSKIAHAYGFTVESCSEDIDLQKFNIEHARCIDDRLLSKIMGNPFSLAKDKYQRESCGCVQSVDIGIYNSCNHACQYCYASYSTESILNNMKKHDPNYPLLLGIVPDDVKIKNKEQKSYKDKQHSLLGL